MGLDAAMNVLTSVVALAWRLEKMVSILSGGGMRRKSGSEVANRNDLGESAKQATTRGKRVTVSGAQLVDSDGVTGWRGIVAAPSSRSRRSSCRTAHAGTTSQIMGWSLGMDWQTVWRGYHEARDGGALQK